MSIKSNPLSKETRHIGFSWRLLEEQVSARDFTSNIYYEKDVVPLQSLFYMNTALEESNFFYGYKNTFNSTGQVFNMRSLFSLDPILSGSSTCYRVTRTNRNATILCYIVSYMGSVCVYFTSNNKNTLLNLKPKSGIVGTYVLCKKYKEEIKRRRKNMISLDKIEFWYDAEKIKSMFTLYDQEEWNKGITHLSKKVKCFEADIDCLFEPVDFTKFNTELQEKMNKKIVEFRDNEIDKLFSSSSLQRQSILES